MTTFATLLPMPHLHYPKPSTTHSLNDFPQGATIATSSTRRKAQLLAARSDLNVIEIRGNVTTRMQKLAETTDGKYVGIK